MGFVLWGFFSETAFLAQFAQLNLGSLVESLIAEFSLGNFMAAYFCINSALISNAWPSFSGFLTFFHKKVNMAALEKAKKTFQINMMLFKIPIKTSKYCNGCVSVELDAIDIVHESFERQLLFGFTGLVAYRTSISTIKFSCTFDVSMFPFDSQTCVFKFGPWALDKDVYRLGMSLHNAKIFWEKIWRTFFDIS